ncbi:MAG: hypothetical protein AAGE43_00025 [Pseudomonadota bacterium]
MTDFALVPYWHPTTICFVDDNESFLQSLDLELPGSWACRTFADPEIALEFLREPVPLAPLMDRCFSLQQQAGERLIRLDLNLVEQEINHVDRFRRNSVLVVDYAMPSINGLRFCEMLDDPFIQKAMLTGVADEKLAVEAFNAGLIHRFIPKQSAESITTVRRFVEELLHEYFNQYTARLKTNLAIDPPEFLVDSTVAEYVHGLMAEHGLVEYYLIDDPPGLLMLRGNGELWRVAILDAADRARQLELARSFGAPAEVLERLGSGRGIVFLPGLSPADYFGDEDFPWAEQLHPAERISERWHVAIWKDAPADVDFDRETASYNAYLATL